MEFTVKIPDAMIAEAETAHNRFQQTLPMEQRTLLVVDDRYARHCVMIALRGELVQDAVIQARLAGEEGVKAVQAKVNDWEGNAGP